jgi:hypothetical protein
MSQLERVEAEQRVKGIVFWTMIGVCVGLVVATMLVSSEQETAHTPTGSSPHDHAKKQTESPQKQASP